MKVLLDSALYVTDFMLEGDGDLFDANGNKSLNVEQVPIEELDRLYEYPNAYKYHEDTNSVIFDHTKYTKIVNEQLKAELRIRRQKECFDIVDRSPLWYNTLTEEQLAELSVWYEAWLHVTDTMTPPEKPSWL